MSDELASLHIQIANTEENLRLLRERKSAYVQESEIPLQLIRNERRLEQRLAELRTALSDDAHASPLASPPSSLASSGRGTGNKAQPLGGMNFSGSTHVDGNVIQAETLHNTVSQRFIMGVPALVLIVFVVSIALMAVVQISGYNFRTLWQDRAQNAALTLVADPPSSIPQEALAGSWQLTRQDASGSSQARWEIATDGERLTIVEFRLQGLNSAHPSDSQSELEVTQFAFDGQQLLLTVLGSLSGVPEIYDLTLENANRLEGTYHRPAQANAESMDAAGSVILARQTE